MKWKAVILILVLLMASNSQLLCQEKDSVQTKEKKILELLQNIKKLTATDSLENYKKNLRDSAYLEFNQLIINETISKLGVDFQDIFNGYWNWPAGLSDPFIIVISERPVLGTNTKIEITVNEIVVYESFLQPRYEVLEEIALEAVNVTTQYVLHFQEVLQQLSGDDMKGTGIY